MKIGVIQLRSVLSPEINLITIKNFLSEAKKEGAMAVFYLTFFIQCQMEPNLLPIL